MPGSTTNSRMLSSALLMSRCESLQGIINSTFANLCHSYYKALTFYLQEQPTLLNDLLTVLIPRIDHSRVVRTFRQIDHIPFIRSYLIAVQHVSVARVHFDFISANSGALVQPRSCEWRLQWFAHWRRRLQNSSGFNRQLRQFQQYQPCQAVRETWTPGIPKTGCTSLQGTFLPLFMRWLSLIIS